LPPACSTPLGRVGTDVTTTNTSILWRLVDGRGGRWIEPTTGADDALTAHAWKTAASPPAIFPQLAC